MYSCKNTISILLSTAVLLLLISCNSESKNTASGVLQKNEEVNLVSVKSYKSILEDSLLKFSDSSDITRRDDSAKYVLYIGKVNNNKIGVIAITDSILFLYQQINRAWRQIDSAAFDTYAFEFGMTDLNGDNREDFIVKEMGDAHGQQKPYVFISDTLGNLHYRRDIRLYNIEYDPVHKMVRSFYQGSAYGMHSKEYYRWQNDSLEFVDGAELDLTSPPNSVTTFYKIRNGKHQSYKTVKDKDGKIFTGALWESD